MTDGASGKIGGASRNDGSGRNRGRFGIRIGRMICDDLTHLNMGRAWRCNSGRTANIATRTCRRIQRRRAFAAMSARSARTARPRSSIMYARIAVADLCRGRSGPHGNGGRALRWPRPHRRTNAYTSHIVLKTSQRIQSGCETFRRSSGERYGDRHSGAMRSIELRCANAHRRISRFRVWC